MSTTDTGLITLIMTLQCQPNHKATNRAEKLRVFVYSFYSR
jgi:hypothetical protein